MNALELRGVAMRFGKQQVLSSLDFSVEEGSIYGFIGQNGAGKTTTMKLILGLLRPQSGSITVCGEAVQYGGAKTNRHIGYLPDVPAFYSYMTAPEYLRLCAELSGLPGHITAARSRDLLEMVGLARFQKKKIGGYSRGMKQRLGIAQALLNEPKLLLCDEPTSALDPSGRKEILDLLAAVRGRTTVLFSTHILADVERICDHAAILHKGSVVRECNLQQWKAEQSAQTLELEFAPDAPLQPLLETIQACPAVVQCTQNAGVLTVQASALPQAQRFILQTLSAQELLPLRIEVAQPSLELLYLQATGEQGGKSA